MLCMLMPGIIAVSCVMSMLISAGLGLSRWTDFVSATCETRNDCQYLKNVQQEICGLWNWQGCSLTHYFICQSYYLPHAKGGLVLYCSSYCEMHEGLAGNNDYLNGISRVSPDPSHSLCHCYPAQPLRPAHIQDSAHKAHKIWCKTTAIEGDSKTERRGAHLQVLPFCCHRPGIEDTLDSDLLERGSRPSTRREMMSTTLWT